MKNTLKYGGFLFTLLILISVNTPVAKAEVNLITNPSVEEGSILKPDNWSHEKKGLNFSFFRYQSNGYDGNKSLLVDVSFYRNGHSGWYFDPVTVEPNTTYSYSEYYKASTETDVYLKIFDSTGKTTEKKLSTLPKTNDWTQHTRTFSTPSNASKITLVHRINDTGTVETDNFSLVSDESATPDPKPTDDNLIPNSSLKTGTYLSPTHWSHEKEGRNISIFGYERDGFNGNHSLNIRTLKHVDGTAGWYFDPLPAKANTEYKYSEDYKASVPTKITLRIFHSNGEITEKNLGSVAKVAEWTRFNTTFVTPADVEKITIIHQIKTEGELNTDNFKLTKGDTVTPKPEPTSSNIIPNPSLEEVDETNPNLPKYWKTSKFGTNNSTFTYLNYGNTGTRALKVEITDFTDGTAYYEFEPQPVEPGETYEYSVRYQADVYAEVDVAITLEDGSVEYRYLGVSYPSPNGWSTYTTRIIMPDDAVKATVYNILYSAGTLITDDYSLTKETIVPLDKPIVTLTFDDAFTTFYDNALPLFKKYDMAGTMYLVSQDFGEPRYMTIQQLLELEANGFEMGSHSVTHPHLPILTSEEVEYELKESKRVIEEKLGHSIDAFATPYGEYNDQVLEQIMSVYDSHRSVDVGYNTKDNFTASNIKAMSPVVDTSPETVLSWVDTAIANNAWLVLVYHDIIDEGGQYTNTPAHLEAVLDGLEKRNVDVMTNKDALNHIESFLE